MDLRMNGYSTNHTHYSKISFPSFLTQNSLIYIIIKKNNATLKLRKIIKSKGIFFNSFKFIFFPKTVFLIL